MKVKDIMIKEVITVTADATIDKVARLLVVNRIHAVPVVENEKVIGIISESDFFTKDSAQIHLPSYIGMIKNLKLKSDSTEERNKIEALIKTRAEDIMTRPCVTVSPDEEVTEVIKLFRSTQFGMIPVALEDSTLVGVIALADIINLVSHL